MTPEKKADLLADAAARGARYTAEIGERRVAPKPEDIARLEALDGPLPNDPCDPAEVIAQLDEFGSPATIASTGGRYFGFVTGGALPAAMAANWLAGAWDQNAALVSQSPVAAKLEEIAASWLLDVLGLPSTSAVGFVTGATMANFTALAAARHALLARAGWEVEDRGLFGAPEIKVVVGAEVHVSLLKALAMLGFGRTRVTRVPVDGQGRMRADALPELDERTLVCIQAGNVNTGAFDPAAEICNRAHARRAWVHVDGAFGLWAAAAPDRAHLMKGFAEADSWATDCHKWLNVPYDSGLAIVREPKQLKAAMSGQAAYLIQGDQREPWQFTPEASRRARGIEIWAALRSLGRRGLAEMIERNCRQAGRFAEGLRAAGFAILNDVVLNQVLVSFGDAEATRRVIREVQADGTCWCGGTEWQGKTAMRISVSSWATTDEDVERSIEAILRIASRYA
jgi:glutamate/tyrosine decarboxylase-like PLP-dependent enzyme